MIKVLKQIGKHLYSVIPGGLNYHHGVVTPLFGKLFIFENLECAELVYNNSLNYEFQFWEIVPGKITQPKFRQEVPMSTADYKRFWDNGKILFPTTIIPDGTLFTNSVKLIERVK